MSRRIAWLPLVAVMAAGTAMVPALAAPNQRNGTAEKSIFPPHQPTRPYIVQNGDVAAGTVGHSTDAPNAGQTGLNGSSGTDTGWVGTAPGFAKQD